MVEKPSRNEDEYFARREAELLRQRRDAAQQAQSEAERKSHYMKCPKCGYDLLTSEWHGVQIDQCPNCRGIWFDAGEAEDLLKRGEQERGVIHDALLSIVRAVKGPRAGPS
ncbi:MAG: zf-TFIIB domain-containing protein [Gemmatimonadales bacterium]